MILSGLSLRAYLGPNQRSDGSYAGRIIPSDGGHASISDRLAKQSKQLDEVLAPEERTENIKELMRLLALQKSIAHATQPYGRQQLNILVKKSNLPN